MATNIYVGDYDLIEEIAESVPSGNSLSDNISTYQKFTFKDLNINTPDNTYNKERIWYSTYDRHDGSIQNRYFGGVWGGVSPLTAPDGNTHFINTTDSNYDCVNFAPRGTCVFPYRTDTAANGWGHHTLSYVLSTHYYYYRFWDGVLQRKGTGGTWSVYPSSSDINRFARVLAIDLQGGGGGGGGSMAYTASGDKGGGGGGGGGGFCTVVVDLSKIPNPDQGIELQAGNRGSGGLAGGTSTVGPGNKGGDTILTVIGANWYIQGQGGGGGKSSVGEKAEEGLGGAGGTIQSNNVNNPPSGVWYGNVIRGRVGGASGYVSGTYLSSEVISGIVVPDRKIIVSGIRGVQGTIEDVYTSNKGGGGGPSALGYSTGHAPAFPTTYGYGAGGPGGSSQLAGGTQRAGTSGGYGLIIVHLGTNGNGFA